MKPHQVKPKLKIALLKGEKITPLIALRRYGCFRLASYINRLRNDGLKITTTMKTKGGSTYAEYSLQ